MIKLGLQSAPFVGLSACAYLFWDASLIIRMWRAKSVRKKTKKKKSVWTESGTEEVKTKEHKEKWKTLQDWLFYAISKYFVTYELKLIHKNIRPQIWLASAVNVELTWLLLNMSTDGWMFSHGFHNYFHPAHVNGALDSISQ